MSEEGICYILVKSLKKRKDNRDDVLREKLWEVLFGSVDPRVEEVVIAVRETFSAPEEFSGGSLIKLGSFFITKRHMNHMEIAVLSHSNPLRKLVSLNSMNWPVPSILTLNDI